MNNKQSTWMNQMRGILNTLYSGKILSSEELKVYNEIKKKIHEACRRLGISKSDNLIGCLDEICTHFSEDWDSPFDEEKEWEKYCDYQHFLRHGNDPWWAQ